jgi:hypothetical protein
MAVESGNASSILGGGVLVVALVVFLLGGFGWSAARALT